jgi:hypothetical protein
MHHTQQDQQIHIGSRSAEKLGLCGWLHLYQNRGEEVPVELWVHVSSSFWSRNHLAHIFVAILSSNYKQGISCRVSYVYRATGLK